MAKPQRPNHREPQVQVEDLFDHRRPKLLLWLNTVVKIPRRTLTLEPGAAALTAAQRLAGEEETVSPEDTLRAAGISTTRQAQYQRRMSNLLAGR